MQVHQIWLQGPPPQKYARNIETWKALHAHRMWDESQIVQLIQAKYPEHLQWFQSLPRLIQKADVSRAFILHAHGGVYADLDYVPHQSFAPLWNNVLSGEVHVGTQRWWVFPDCINNAVILSAPGASFWTEFLAYAQAKTQRLGALDSIVRQYIPTWDVVAVTGPIAYARIGGVKRIRGLYDGFGSHEAHNAWFDREELAVVAWFQIALTVLAICGLVAICWRFQIL